MISSFFIERPRFAFVISIVMILAGIICALRLPIAEYPEIAPPSITVRATYPGASAQVIANTIASPLEAEINGIENLLYYESTSDNAGNYQLQLTFRSGCDDDIAQVNVQNALKRAEPTLPQEVVALGIQVNKQSQDILGFFNFSSTNPAHSRLFISNYVNMNVKNEIARIQGVSNATIFGALDYSMRIWLDPLYMSALGVSPEDIASAINGQNVQAAAGTIGAEMSNDVVEFKLNALGRLETPEQFGNIVVKTSKDGNQLRLKDVAKIELGAASYTGNSYISGDPTTAMAVYRISDANALEVVQAIDKRLKELQVNFPDKLTYRFSYDPTLFIQNSIQEIVYTLLLTFGLVVAITYLFLQDWRATLIPSITIPVSLIGTFIFLAAAGMSLNVLTLFALILVIGSVVDDAIVVVENTMRLIEEEKLSPREAAHKSMHQITGAIIATTLVTLAVYAPIAAYGGMIGTIYLQFAVTMSIALMLSTVNALTLSPPLCALLLRHHEEPKYFFKLFNIVLNWIRAVYLLFVKFAVRFWPVTIIIFCGCLYFIYFTVTVIPTSFVPPEDKGALFGAVELPPGATLKRTDEVIFDFCEKIGKIPGIKDVLGISGFNMMSGNGENQGFLVIILDPWEERKSPEKSLDAIMNKVKVFCELEPSARIQIFAPPAIMGLGAANGVSGMIVATGGQSIEQINQDIQPYLNAVRAQPYTIFAMTSFDASTQQLYLDVDRAKAEAMNIPVSRIFNTLQSKLSAMYINDFNIYGYSYKVKMQANPEARSSLNNIMQINVKTNNGKIVPLSVLANVRNIIGPRQIKRFNQYQAANLTVVNFPNISTNTVMTSLKELAAEVLPREYRIEWTGASYEEQGNEGRIIFLLAFSLVFAYLFLVAQYESFTLPVSVILSVAIAVLGACIGLMIWKMFLSIYAQLGLLMLVGLASKNAILIVEFSKQRRQEGASIPEAALDGARARFRAVLMTALSFVIGVYPMVVATGAGSASRIAIGVPTFCGMILATVVGIIFVPALYAIFQRFRESIMGSPHDNKTTEQTH